MEYKHQQPPQPKVPPRLIIHGGAGNITPASLPLEERRAYREALFTIVSLSMNASPLLHPGPASAAYLG